ncbi:MAG: alpha-2-macroglobulin, partial [Dehalococcoidia bacterium]|nr:alpha-2-macroglobulin [Dehalococcoidia bacterium]
DRAEALLALSDFAASTGELAGDFSYRVQAGERELLAGQFAPAKAVKKESQDVALTTFQKGTMTNIAFLRDFARPGRLYYTLNLRYLTPAKDVEAISRGIAVSHRYSALSDDSKAIGQAKVGEVVRVTVTVVAPAERDYVVVNDLLPAGLEPIDPQLKTTDPALAAKLQADRAASRPADALYYAPWFGWYWSPFDQVVTRDDRVTLRATKLPKGVHEFVYYARATTPGDFFVAPAHAEESFFPEVFGRSDSGRFGVTP